MDATATRAAVPRVLHGALFFPELVQLLPAQGVEYYTVDYVGRRQA